MPVITYDKKDLLNLIGRNLSDEELENVINSIKPSVEKITETEITLEHTADRPDLFGIEGLGRAIRSYLNIQPGLKKYKVDEAKLSVKVDDVRIRPYIAAAIIRNVEFTNETIKSLMNIQEVLHETIGRKRRKVAIGLHDLDKISPPISYTQVKKDAKMVPLEFEEEMELKEILQKVPKGKEYGYIINKAKLWPVYVDGKGIFSFPPIINSDRTKVTEKTKNLFIELTGMDKEAVKQTLNIIVTNIAERGATIEAVRLNYKKKTEITPNLAEDVKEIDIDYTNKWIGLNLSPKEIKEILERMGYGAIEVNSKKIEVIIPPYRFDILHIVDILEDIAIGYGYNNLVPELPNVATVGKPHPIEKLSAKIRNMMISLGFQEIIRPILSNFSDQFKKMNLRKKKVVTLLNPVSEEYTCLRISLLPSLLKFLANNKHVDYPQYIFEIGDVVIIDEKEETRTKNIRKVSAAISDSQAGFADIKSRVEHLLKGLNLDYELIPTEHPSFIKGRVCSIVINERVLGVFGEIHPKVLENWNLEMPVAAFELEIENL